VGQCSRRSYAARPSVPYSGAVRRIPLILAVVALVAGLGLIAMVFINGDSAGPSRNTAFTPGSPSATTDAAPESASATPAASASAPAKAAVVQKTTPYKFPVLGKASYARTHHDYPASDIIAPCGAQIVSPVNGVVLEVTLVDTWTAKVNSGATRGGLSWSILGDDGVRYYGSHAASIESAIRAGRRVTAGQKLGKVGDTGDASACHVHFGLSPVCRGTGDWWIRRGVIFPWSYLDAWRAGTAKNPASAIKAWQAKNGCPSKPVVDP
jgi:murein DD-endopeptidase MepM/ murein hydrolase activator NlpD